ncbi:phosphotransferase enzyme family domain protein [Moniliophthora roreri MCA 2997]|uniref:Phosphotransferase enzyme family domain protein n=1 Tax=Moniliophthora roreri (strain MCA 2997) TaxID=1381753 RepID=V2YZY2_MONRO|nr:phosphotransferase enzyme family domain protein [Moniliophthora roreri MCA 2997]
MSSDAQPKYVGGEYGDIRANINIPNLTAYLEKNLSGLKTPLEVKQFKFGQSNPTYFLTDANKRRYVLRKKPAGQLLSRTAHQVDREYTVLHALHKYNLQPSTPPEKRVPVPEPYLLCEDESVIGTAFYVMEFLDGRIFTDVRLLDLPDKDRKEILRGSVYALAKLSSVDPDAIGLSKFGPSTDYFPRQIKAFTRISEAQAAAVDVDTGKAVGKVPFYDEMIKWYYKHVPNEQKFGKRRIVHGDYKLDNMVFHPTENRVIGILDWELCTLGSPLADFANLTQPWGIDPKHIAPYNLPAYSVKAFKNNPSKDVPISLEEMERLYCQLMEYEFPIKELVFVRSWNMFRGAVISQGIAARAARRQASSENPEQYAQSIALFSDMARKILEDEGMTVDLQSKL